MDIVDRDMEAAETQASRTWSQTSKERRERESLERRQTRDTISSSSGSSSSSDASMSRIATASAPGIGAQGVRTRTHPVEDHRTETHRLQHSQTVGSHPTKTRTNTEAPLPEFGGGKSYPPPLPEREEYVVEFDGKDDPLHPQNWPLKRKWVDRAVL